MTNDIEHISTIMFISRLPRWLSSKESTCNAGDTGSIPGLGRPPGRGHDNPLQYSCLENPHGQKRLASYSPWCCKESDMTEQLSTAHNWSPCFPFCILTSIFFLQLNYSLKWKSSILLPGLKPSNAFCLYLSNTVSNSCSLPLPAMLKSRWTLVTAGAGLSGSCLRNVTLFLHCFWKMFSSHLPEAPFH